MRTKRIFDICVSVLGLFFLAPFFLLIGILIKINSPGKVFYSQNRIGQFGVPFRIYKFRTMVENNSGSGMQITVGQDPRITGLGFFLRKIKADELPQLWNVLVGDMSLVGPRPEVEKYISYYPSDARQIIQNVKPGITDWSSIYFRNESKILAESKNPEFTYVTEIIPLKVSHYTAYATKHTFFGDLHIIFATLVAIFRS